jgi:DNA-binding transcriptional MerR regulator
MEERTMPLTITRLAPRRSAGNYRVYADGDLVRLRQVCAYRDAGLKLRDICSLLEGPRGDAAGVLKRRLLEIGREIETLREHQRAIARLLGKAKGLRRNPMVTKKKWVEIMRAAGFSEEQMHRWHREFERAAPAEHQEFLEFLQIPPEEVRQIREWSAGK